MLHTVTIYSLKCPISGQIKYVGKTINAEERLAGHSTRRRRTGNISRCMQWVLDLTAQGLIPILEPLEEFEIELAEGVNKSKATIGFDYIEQYWIEQIRQWGYPLLNIAHNIGRPKIQDR